MMLANDEQPTMREQIEGLIAELETTARQHEANAESCVDTTDSIREMAKATATYRAITRVYSLLTGVGN